MEKLSERLVSWASLIDEVTVEQARTSSRMPFIYPPPRAHARRAPGPRRDRGVGDPHPRGDHPAAVGVDIGCGVIAVRTQFTGADCPEDRRMVREQIERAILLGEPGDRKVVATAEPRIAELEALAEQKGSTRRRTSATGATSSARSAAATTSSRSRSTRPTRCGCSCTREAGA